MRSVELEHLISCGASVNVTLTASELMQLANDIAGKVAEKLIADKNEDKDGLMTVKEVCEYLGVSSQTLWRWHKLGYLCKMHVGDCVRYSRADVMNVGRDCCKDKV